MNKEISLALLLADPAGFVDRFNEIVRAVERLETTQDEEARAADAGPSYSVDASVAPDGLFDVPTLRTVGPPTWLPESGTRPTLIDSEGLIFHHDGTDWLELGGGAGGGGTTVTVRETDGTPTGLADTIQFSQSTGLSVASVAANVATVAALLATPTQPGVVGTGPQAFAGEKRFSDDVRVGLTTDASASSIYLESKHTSDATYSLATIQTYGVTNALTALIEDRTDHSRFSSWRLYPGAAGGTGSPTFVIAAADAGGSGAESRYGAVDSGGTTRLGGTATTGGLTFYGGLYVSGTITGGGGITTEDAQDAAAALFTSGTHSGITFAYDDAAGKVNATVSFPAAAVTAVSDTATVDLTLTGTTLSAAVIPAGLPAFLGAGASHAKGAVPDPGATAHAQQPYVLRDDATWGPQRGGRLGSALLDLRETTTSATPVPLTPVTCTFTLDETTTVWILGTCVADGSAVCTPGLNFDVDGTGVVNFASTLTIAGAAYGIVGLHSLSLLAGARTVTLRYSTNAGTTGFGYRRLYVWRG